VFANGADWRALEVLDFSANEIGDQGAAAIAAAEMTSLRWLNLSSNDTKQQLTIAGAKSLAESKTLGALETLNVYGHPVGGRGVIALACSPKLRSLEALCTAFPGCSLPDVTSAADSKTSSKLRELHLGHPDAPKKKAEWSRAKFLENVRMLNVESISGKEYEGVLACPHLGELEVLAFGGCYTDADVAFEAMVRAKPPPKLRYLDLNGWKMTADQAERFVASPIGQQLWGLSTMSMYVSPEAWRVFYDAGLPLVGYAVVSCDPASENRSSTTFREEF
jgi:hypothetical protein